jgi:hypothetical protein
MRRTLCLVLAATLAFASATALAASRTYRGGIEGDPESSLTLKVKKGDGDRFMTGFVARNFAISCDGPGDARLRSAALTGATRVTGNDRFSVTAENETQKLVVAGELLGKRAARGSLRYSGLTEVDDRERECASGRLSWRASR